MQNAAAAGLVALYFLWFAGPWITAGFTPDDLLNCHRALEQPLWKLLLDHVTVYLPTPEYRPLGSLFYRVFYRAFGFDPLPFHLGLYVVLAANVALTYFAVRRIANNASAAWIAAVLHAWHGNWTTLHLSVGFVFDVLCYFFYAAALVAFGAGRLWLFLALYLLCLDSKEVAVSLPLVCLVWKGRECRPSAMAAVAACAITACYIGGRVMIADGLPANAGYVTTFDGQTFVARVTGFLDMAVYGGGARLRWGVAILAASIFWGLLWRTQAAVVALTILVAGVLPVAFIPQRSLESVYVPSLGAVILLALPLARLCPHPLLATCLALLIGWQLHHSRRYKDPEAHLAESNHIMAVAAQMRQAAPCLRPGANVRFIRDPFPQFGWNSLFLARLLYNDMQILVDRPGRPAQAAGDYDAVFDWDEEAGGGGPGHGALRRSSLEATSANTIPNTTPSK